MYPSNWLLDTTGQPVLDTEGRVVTDGSAPQGAGMPEPFYVPVVTV